MKRYGFLLLLALATLVLVTGCARLTAAQPGEDGTIEVVMHDYNFTPDVIRLEAGQTVTLRLRNEGEKMHEFMAGRDVQIHGNLTEGFGEDFFSGLDLQIEGPGMVMGLEGEGMQMDMGGDTHDEGTDMGADTHDEGMDMGADTHAEDAGMSGEAHDEGMDMGGMGTEAEDTMEAMPAQDGEEMAMAEDGHQAGEEAAGGHDEGGGGHDEEEGVVAGRFGVVQRPLMDAHAGMMIMIDPQMIPAGEATTVTFTVPAEKAGTWQFGCFQEQGQHFDDGMNGLIIVES